MTSDDIAVLLSRVALKDRAAFSTLYSRTGSKLFSICIRILKDRSDAEEALQEVYIRIWQRADSFAAAGNSPMGWLATIARYYCIDRIRARRPANLDLDDAVDIADLAPDPEQNAVLSGEGKRIDSCMEQLDSDRAKAVRHAYVEGLSYQELAVQFGVPLNTMRTWLRRSLLKLRECLDR